MPATLAFSRNKDFSLIFRPIKFLTLNCGDASLTRSAPPILTADLINGYAIAIKRVSAMRGRREPTPMTKPGLTSGEGLRAIMY